jgi:hypothetical protein
LEVRVTVERTAETFLRFWESITVGEDELAVMNRNVTVIRERLLGSFPWRTAPPASPPADPGSAQRPDGDQVITVQLGKSRPAGAPLELVHMELMGSAARGTLVKPAPDVDLLVVFQADEGPAVFHNFSPLGLVEKIAAALAGIGQEIVVWQGESVTVRFAEGADVDVFPAFRLYNYNQVYFPRQGTAWFRSAPPAFDRQFLAANERLGQRLTTVAKYAKVWNRNHDKLFQSFHLEALIERDVTEVDDCRRVSLHQFFLQAAKRGQPFLSVPSPDGIYADLSFYMTEERKQRAMVALEFAASVSGFALSHEVRGDFIRANQFWHAVFGPGFPLLGGAGEPSTAPGAGLPQADQ